MDPVDNDRRGFLLAAAAASGAGGLGSAGRAATAGADLGRAFVTAFGAPVSDIPARLDFLLDDAVIVVDDVPFPLDRAGYADHLRFLADQWQTLAWSWHGIDTRVHGDSGIISAFYNARGKPRGAGFRLRAGYCTAVCARTAAGWRAIALHMSPLVGQLLDASPS